MHVMKTGLSAEKFASFWMFPKRFYDSFVFQMTLIDGFLGDVIKL